MPERKSIAKFSEDDFWEIIGMLDWSKEDDDDESSWRPGRPFSSDNFLYARACVVANGKAFYEKVLADPAQMPKDLTFEPLLSLARKAYQKKTGAAFDYFPTNSYETFSNPEGWE